MEQITLYINGEERQVEIVMPGVHVTAFCCVGQGPDPCPTQLTV